MIKSYVWKLMFRDIQKFILAENTAFHGNEWFLNTDTVFIPDCTHLWDHILWKKKDSLDLYSLFICDHIP